MPAPQAPDAWSVRTDTESRATGTTVIVAGRLGTEGARDLRAALWEVAAPGLTIHVDLAGVDYISSAGLAVLREVATLQRSSGGSLVIEGPSDMVSLALRLAGGL